MFRYKTGIALNVADLFAILETELAAAGWILVAGGGTTTIVYRSTGELGTFSKLYIRFRRDAVNTDRIYYRVQDDAAGTHTTTETYYLDCPGTGITPVSYWMTIDKNMCAVVVLDGVTYTGAYVGSLEPFSLVIADERMRHCSLPLYNTTGKMLMRYDGTFDYACFHGFSPAAPFGFRPSLLDASRPLIASLVRNTGDNKEIYGEPYNVAGLNYNQWLGMSSQDTMTTGFAGATSAWIVFVNGSSQFWALLTNGTKPTGRIEEAGFYYAAGVYNSGADIQTAISTFLAAKGYATAAWHAPTYPDWDIYATSTGESGTENIRLRIGRSGGVIYLNAVDQNAAGYHSTGNTISVGAPEFPCNGEVVGDADCLIFAVYHGGAYEALYVGKFVLFYPDESVIPFERKMGTLLMPGAAPNQKRLRSEAGIYGYQCTEFAEVYSNSCPNRVDGNTYVPWPMHYTEDAANSCTFGVAKYLRRLSGVALVIGDTVSVGAKTFKYCGSNWAIRTV